jgi:hypothetical protein
MPLSLSPYYGLSAVDRRILKVSNKTKMVRKKTFSDSYKANK